MNRTNVYEIIGGLLAVCYGHVTNRKHWLLLTLFVLLAPSLMAQQARQKVMVGGIQRDTLDTLITSYKVEAAMALALDVSGRYELIPNSTRDSIVRTFHKDSITIQAAADKLGAELIAFCSIGRVANLVRMEVVITGGEGWIVTTSGTGYASTSLLSDSSRLRIIDPAILTSTQRALCGALLDSALYADADSGLNARPTQLAAIGGIEFIPGSSDLAPWSIIREKIAASYDAASTIAASMRGNDMVTVADIETRDSIYALARLYMVENYNPPSGTEIKTLMGFEFTHIITGRFERVRGGAQLTLVYNEIQPNASYTPVRKATTIVPVDVKLALQDGVRTCLRQLFGAITEPVAQKK
ncbi:MAG: hypothetical protein NTX15_10475 [Candidatus Kapabacteria bacterium]|nr:hypothetical protein [Candidatus Kapabacteria bacterium]